MKRIREPMWDIAKGIGVFLVIAGHMPQLMPTVVKEWIYSFHMPLFFFISGYFATIYGDKSGLRGKILRVIKRIVVPYCAYSVILGILLGFYQQDKDYTLDMVKDTLLGRGSYTALWFLFSLALMEIMFAVSAYFLREKEWMFAIPCVAAGFAFCYFKINIFNIGSTLYGFGFYYLGFCSHEKKVFQSFHRIGYSLLAVFVNVAGVWLLLKNNGRTLEIFIGTCYDIAINYITAISAIFAVVQTARLLTNYKVGKLLEHIGRNSLYYYPLTAFIPDYCKLVIGESAIVKIVSRVVAFPITYGIVKLKCKLQKSAPIRGEMARK